MDLRLARAVEGALPSPDIDGEPNSKDEARDVRYKPRGSGPHCYRQPVRDAEPDLGRAHGSGIGRRDNSPHQLVQKPSKPAGIERLVCALWRPLRSKAI